MKNGLAFDRYITEIVLASTVRHHRDGMLRCTALNLRIFSSGAAGSIVFPRSFLGERLAWPAAAVRRSIVPLSVRSMAMLAAAAQAGYDAASQASSTRCKSDRSMSCMMSASTDSFCITPKTDERVQTVNKVFQGIDQSPEFGSVTNGPADPQSELWLRHDCLKFCVEYLVIRLVGDE
jgi:hypothetical protein